LRPPDRGRVRPRVAGARGGRRAPFSSGWRTMDGSAMLYVPAAPDRLRRHPADERSSRPVSKEPHAEPSVTSGSPRNPLRSRRGGSSQPEDKTGPSFPRSAKSLALTLRAAAHRSCGSPGCSRGPAFARAAVPRAWRSSSGTGQGVFSPSVKPPWSSLARPEQFTPRRALA